MNKNDRPEPAIGQVWKSKHVGACEVKLNRVGLSGRMRFGAVQLSEGLVTLKVHGCTGHVGRQWWLSQAWFDNAEFVRFAVQKDVAKPLAPTGDLILEKLDLSELLLPRLRCAWCGIETEYHSVVYRYAFCCGIHKSEYENSPGGSWLAEVAQSAQRVNEQAFSETVTIAGITMSRAQYEERCAEYDLMASTFEWIRQKSVIAQQDFHKPDNDEAGHPWSCEDVDYVVMG